MGAAAAFEGMDVGTPAEPVGHCCFTLALAEICCNGFFSSSVGATSPVQPTRVCDHFVSLEPRWANESNKADVPRRDLSSYRDSSDVSLKVI